MSSFKLYLELGIHHILDLQGYDHILFLVVLCAIYRVREWKKVLILITAFTIGHTATLALATFNLLNIKSEIIEFLIPVTIVITALSNYFYKGENNNRWVNKLRYSAGLFFGLIHGLGFSNYIKSLLGNESSIIKPLLAFNIGIELGQIFIVVILFSIIFLLVRIPKVSNRHISYTFSSIGLIISLILAWNRFPLM